jgi:hypothetical protein
LEICNQAGIKFRAGVFKNIFALSLEKIDMRGLEISASAAGLKSSSITAFANCFDR